MSPPTCPPAPGGWGLSQCRLLEPMLASPFRVLFWVIVLGSPQHWWEHRGAGLPDSLPTSQQLLGARVRAGSSGPLARWFLASSAARGCVPASCGGGAGPAQLPAVWPDCCSAALGIAHRSRGHCGHGNSPTNREGWVRRAFLCPSARSCCPHCARREGQRSLPPRESVSSISSVPPVARASAM